MSCENEANINSLPFYARMQVFHSERSVESSESLALEMRIKLIDLLNSYLQYVPIDTRAQLTEPEDPKLRKQLFHQRGCICEICQRKIDNKFQLHHTNYSKGNDPDYLKILCLPCHQIVSTLTGCMSWFQQEMVALDKDVARLAEADQKEDEIQSTEFIAGKQPAYTRMFQTRQNKPSLIEPI